MKKTIKLLLALFLIAGCTKKDITPVAINQTPVSVRTVEKPVNSDSLFYNIQIVR